MNKVTARRCNNQRKLGFMTLLKSALEIVSFLNHQTNGGTSWKDVIQKLYFSGVYPKYLQFPPLKDNQ